MLYTCSVHATPIDSSERNSQKLSAAGKLPAEESNSFKQDAPLINAVLVDAAVCL